MRKSETAGQQQDNCATGFQSIGWRRSQRRKSFLLAAAAAMCAASGLSNFAMAATDTWTGNAGTDWDTVGNWNGNNPPVSGDSLEFSSTNAAGTSTLTDTLTSSTFAIAGITYDLGSPAYVQTGNAFELTGAITDNETTNAQTINNNIMLGASESVVTAAGANITLGGVIGGAFNVTATGPGAVTLTGANTFSGTGGIIVSAGTSLIPGSTVTVSPGASALSQNGDFTVGAYSRLTLNSGSGGITESPGTNTNNGTTTLSGTGVINYNNYTVNNGTFIIDMATPATQVVLASGANSNPFTGSGSLIIEQGTVIASSTKNNAGFGTAVVTLGDANGATDGTNPTALVQGQQSWTTAINVVGTGTGQNTIATSNGRTYSGAITLSNANVILQATYIANALVTFNPSSLTGTGNVTLYSPNGTNNYNYGMTFGGSPNPTGIISTTGPGAIAVTGTLGSNITGFTQGSSVTTTFSGTGNFTGATTVNSGSLLVSGKLASNTDVVNGGTLSVTSAGSLAANLVTISPAASGYTTLVLSSATALTTSATINAVTTVGTPRIYLAFSGTPLTIFSLEVNGTPVPNGTYSSSAEPTADPTLFGANTGTLTVVPEPASLGLFGVAGVALMRRRRKAVVEYNRS